MKKNGLRKRLLAAALAVVLAVPVTAVSMPAESVQAKTVRLDEDDFSISGDLDDAKKVLNAMMRGDKIIFLCMPDYQRYQIKERLKELTDTDISVKITMQKVRRRDANGVYYCTRPVITAKASKAYINALKKQNAQIVKEIDPVSSATQELAQEIHDHLSKQESYIFYTNGKPKQIIKNLYPMIKAINKQGVIFKYTAKRVKGVDGTYYKVTINKEEAQKYYYACALIQKVFDRDKTKNVDCFNDLSDIMKLRVISASNMFSCLSGGYMSYNAYKYSPVGELNRLISLYNETASGVCIDFAEAEEALFSMLGIDVHIVQTKEHAWTEGVAANSDGVMVKYMFDYQLYCHNSSHDIDYSLCY